MNMRPRQLLSLRPHLSRIAFGKEKSPAGPPAGDFRFQVPIRRRSGQEVLVHSQRDRQVVLVFDLALGTASTTVIAGWHYCCS